MSFQNIQFLGLPLTTGMAVEDVCNLLSSEGKGTFITFINPYAWHFAVKKPEYRPALAQMTYVLPDGIAVASLCEKMMGVPCHRTSFDMTSVAGPFFTRLVAERKTLMLIGGTADTAQKVQEKLLQEYPGLTLLEPLDGYETLENQVIHVMRYKPDVVIAAMGLPKQELLLVRLKDSGYKGLAITCGGFFDQYLQATQYYPPFIDQLNLRFVYRLYKEPKRLWHRYLVEYQEFIFTALRAMFTGAKGA